MEFLPEGVTFNKDITYLAKTNFRNREQVFGIKRKDRRQHMYVLGKSGTGKSVLLQNMIVQNIWNGEGVCVVDPHGELVESILATIPPHRIKDVVYFNPADTDYHIGFNVLQIDDPKYKHLVASGLMGIFTKIWANAWSARMEYILNNAILALLETPGSTLLGIPRLLVDKDYRQQVINNIKDPVIKSFWIHEFESWRDQYRNEAIAPIQNKVGQFLSTSIVRNVVGQAKSTIDLFNVMNTGKIFLVNVSKGRIGEDNSALLGGMLITKLQLAAMERVRIAEEDRRDFYLYVDEFQNFVTDSFASILSEARKYRLNLTIAHQYIGQLSTKEGDTVRDAVFGNVGTMIIFRVGAADGEFLEKEFEPEFMTQDMVSLPNYHVYMKLMVDGVTSRPFSAGTLPPIKIPENSTVAQEITDSSRKLYARPRENVEREINEWSGVMTSEGSNDNGGEGKFKAQCSSCGKETMVPFEPEPGRPVYCRDCIGKIKSGELKPLRGTRGKGIEPQSFAPLATLGIEFASSGAAAVRTPTQGPARAYIHPTMRTPTHSEPQHQHNGPVSKAAPVPSARVSSTTATPPQAPQPVTPPQPPYPDRVKLVRPQKERKGPDHEGLQSVLKQALGNVLSKVEDDIRATSTTATPPVIVPPAPPKPTISLSSLKKTESSATTTGASKIPPKIASEEHLSALQQAIARATNHSEAATAIKKEEAPVSVSPKPVEEKPTEISKEIFVGKKEEPVVEPKKPEPVPETKPTETSEEVVADKKEEPKAEAPKTESKEEKEEPKKTGGKVVKEVPEDILRSVLD